MGRILEPDSITRFLYASVLMDQVEKILKMKMILAVDAGWFAYLYCSNDVCAAGVLCKDSRVR
ncbi:hypothetical protein AF72_05345 [Xylella taiwanensis]|uniref:Uncharacterized protein n=1 Tax=Xylella taiwanensis TaxID=1444770 RepID=Z9JL36_9GAMM|nr:hypothetical protein AB672_02645 [Xylella taiwanensis]EWS78482.1 hypothetical protein AF72_05345 [Xylella taiwanensis]